MSIQAIYQTYLSDLSNEERLELIRLLIDGASFTAVEALATPEEKLQIANRLRAEATAQQWQELSRRLPDVPTITMDEIVQAVKEVRRLSNQ